MTNKNNDFVEENPFQYLKLRWLVFWFFLMMIVFAIQLSIISELIFKKSIDTESPFYNEIIIPILIILIFIFLIGWLLRQFDLIGIKTEHLIGKIPPHYKWLNLVTLVIGHSFMFSGIYRILAYLISFIYPEYVQFHLEKYALEFLQSPDSLSETLLFSIFGIMLYFITVVVLHRLSYKWGQKNTFIIFALFYFILGLHFIPFMFAYLTEFIIFPLIYLESLSFIVLIISCLIDFLINNIWFWFRINIINDLYVTNIAQLREQLWLGILYLILGTPIIVSFLRKNWHKLKEPLPYFINKAQDPNS